MKIHIKKKSWQNKFIMQCYHVNMSWLSSHKINNLEWRMVKSETRRDTEILVRNPSPRLFGEKVSRLKKSKSKP